MLEMVPITIIDNHNCSSFRLSIQYRIYAMTNDTKQWLNFENETLHEIDTDSFDQCDRKNELQ